MDFIINVMAMIAGAALGLKVLFMLIDKGWLNND